MGDGLEHAEGGIPLPQFHLVHVVFAAAYSVSHVLVPPASLEAQFSHYRAQRLLGGVASACQLIADFASHASDDRLLTIHHAPIYSGDDYPG